MGRRWSYYSSDIGSVHIPVFWRIRPGIWHLSWLLTWALTIPMRSVKLVSTVNLVVIDSSPLLFYDQVGTSVWGMPPEICEDGKRFVSLRCGVDGCSVDKESEWEARVYLFQKGITLFSPGLQGSHLIDRSARGWPNFPKQCHMEGCNHVYCSQGGHSMMVAARLDLVRKNTLYWTQA